MAPKSTHTMTPPNASTSNGSPRNGKVDDRPGKLHRMPRTLAGTPAPTEDTNRKTLLATYEKAIHLMQTGNYNEAHEAFNQLLAGAPHDLADRIRMYIAACVSQIDHGTTEFRSHEERYDYAISLLNHGNYDDAREQFAELLLAKNDCDYAFYGLALLASLTNSSHECLEHLEQAIKLNPQYRIQARSDSDFANMSDDPRFTELLYPEA